MEEDSNKRKRIADGDSEPDSPESKVTRVRSESDVSDSSTDSELTRVSSGVNWDDAPLDSPGSRDILDILEDTDNVAERDSSMQGLDSVIKSFEEEILAPGLDTVPESDKLQTNLGYLLEASDDELGLPPTVSSGEGGKPETEDAGRVLPECVDFNFFAGFEDDMPNYASLGFGSGVFLDGGADDYNGGGFVTLDGLFDYAEPADSLWRPESLRAR